MSQFEWDAEKEREVAKSFGVDVKTVRGLRVHYTKIYDSIKNQYLAHAMRVLEEYIRQKEDAPYFCITCAPASENQKCSKKGWASYNKGVSFDILFDPQMDEKQARVKIAHELGHFLLMILANKDYNDKIEPLSSIMGIFTILDKNDFYVDKSSKFVHKSWQDVVSDFCQIKNAEIGRPNIS